MRYKMLTQDNCPNCAKLKMMLEKPLKGKFDSVIEVVHRQENPEAFLAAVKENQVSSVPVIIDTETNEVLRDFSSGVKISAFLSK